MNPESLEGPVSLAHALINWTEPTLIEAIRAETAKVDPAELDRTGRYTLESIFSERRKPQRGRTLYLAKNPFAALDRAWDRLFNHVRLLIEQGIIVLKGFDNLALSFTGPVAEWIPPTSASELDFDPAAGAVFLNIHTYTTVSAYRRPGSVQSVDVAATGPSDARPIGSTGAEPHQEAADAPPRLVGDIERGGRGRESMEPFIQETLHARWDPVQAALRKGDELEDAGDVELGKRAFVAVRVSQHPFATTAQEVNSAKRSAGRPAIPMAELASIASGRSRVSNNKQEAASLIAELGARFPGVKAPAHRTVADRVNDIYRLASRRD